MFIDFFRFWFCFEKLHFDSIRFYLILIEQLVSLAQAGYELNSDILKIQSKCDFIVKCGYLMSVSNWVLSFDFEYWCCEWVWYLLMLGRKTFFFLRSVIRCFIDSWMYRNCKYIVLIVILLINFVDKKYIWGLNLLPKTDLRIEMINIRDTCECVCICNFDTFRD
jgi:hypothetical protein